MVPLAIGVHELAAMSERRIERLVNPAYSELPAFLVGEGGLNSGFMIAHCTAAALGKFILCLLQVNEYETAPNLIQLTQNLTSNCWLI